MQSRPMERSKSSTKVSEVSGIDDSNGDERAFNETIKRMLKTPPQPHASEAKKPAQEMVTEPKPSRSR